jgi:L-cysteine S-thiosulfotransferase
MGRASVGILALSRNKTVRLCLKLLLVLAVQCSIVAGCAHRAASGPPQRAAADAMEQPLTATPGDPARGREIVFGRDGNCLFCHAIPGSGERFMGNIGPPLSGVASKLTAGQLRLRIVDPTRLKPDIVMPAYHRVEGLDQVARQYRGRPILQAQQVEDVIAYLLTLK